MADGTSYPVRIQNADRSVREAGTLVYEDAAAQPVPLDAGGIQGTFVLPAAVDGSALPTADPAVAGQLWNNAGVVTVSAG